MKWIVSSIFVLGNVTAIGCGADSSSGSIDKSDPFGSSTEQEKWLTRSEMPESEFRPQKLESVFDDLVDELNQHEKEDDLSLAFVPKDMSPYFKVSMDGAFRALDELKVLGNVVALNPNTVSEADTKEQQIAILQKQIAGGTDGIGLAPAGDEVIPELENAISRGTAVITFDNDLPTSPRQLYVGTINATAGAEAGKTMIELLGDTQGTVVVLGTTDTTWTDGFSRTDEARKVLEEKGYSVTVINADWDDSAVNIQAIVDAAETADPSVVGCLGVFSNSYQCADGAIEAGIIDQIKIATFDFDPVTLAYLETGKIQVTHAQRQYFMGYMVPYLLYAINALGLEETKQIIADLMVDDARVDTGVDVIYHTEVAAYDTFLQALGVR